jgi:Uma2 family endonuclease
MSTVLEHGEIVTLADLLARLGNVPLDRVRFRPVPGTAVEQDVIDLHDRENRLFELVDGVLVEKPMGFREARIATVISVELELHMRESKLGIVAGADAMMRIATGLVRMPDVSVVLWENLPGRKVPPEPIPSLAPDLAVEVLSVSNTPAEIDRKLAEYFAAGCRCAWIVDVVQRSVRVYRSPSEFDLLSGEDAVTAENVVPGFGVAVSQIFRSAGID